MDYEQIKQIMKDVENSTLNSVEIKFSDGTNIKMEKYAHFVIPEEQLQNDTEETRCIKDIETTKNLTVQKQEMQENEDGNIIKSPMVGTFYSSSGPEKEPYVKLGDVVKKGDTLCIIEAMKLMNEIESEFDGQIVEIFVTNEQMVEYGMPLFKIK
jgi:acetyl-CoA carboxylase biotin carboxyl carrier protein